MPFRYVPMLRTKAGEVTALRHLTVQQKNRIFPVFSISEAPPANFASSLAAIWQQRDAALDGTYNQNFTGCAAIFDSIFGQLGQSGVRVIPSIGCSAPPAYLASVQAKVGQFAPGLVIRAALNEISTVRQWVHQQGWATAQADLIIDAGHIGQLGAGVITSVLVSQCNQFIVPAAGWRSVSFVAASIPRDFGAIPLGTNVLPRMEWAAWLGGQPNVQIPLHYGDYSTSHPDMVEPPGYVMANATVSVKYTTDNDWLAIKGRPITGQHGIPMALQYRTHATTLTNDHRFAGVPNCWADGKISQIASQQINSGSRPTWVQIAVNRHLSLVADRLP